jgi:hypothetical protein
MSVPANTYYILVKFYLDISFVILYPYSNGSNYAGIFSSFPGVSRHTFVDMPNVSSGSSSSNFVGARWLLPYAHEYNPPYNLSYIDGIWYGFSPDTHGNIPVGTL